MRAIAVLALAAAGCTSLRSDFVCEADVDCESASGQAGRCEPTGRCSFPDPACASGHRYTSYAGELSGRCTSLDDCVADLSAGETSTCVLSGNAVWCWGEGYGGASPVRQELPPGELADIEVGGSIACARYTDGRVACWKGPVIGVIEGAIAGMSSQDLAIGKDHACAVTGGRVACWGNNRNGQLGDGTIMDTIKSVPDFVDGSTGITDVRQVAAGEDTTCAVTGMGAGWCWGNDDLDQLGQGPNGNFEVSRPVRANGGNPPPPPFESIAVGTKTTCATAAGGEVYCWGLNDRYQLAFDSILDSVSTPYRIGLAGVDRVTPGGGHVCALGRDLTVHCWGVNDTHQCAAAPAVDVTAPRRVVHSNGDPLLVTAIETGDRHTCGRSAGDGHVYCWGANDAGQLGNGVVGSTAEPSRAMFECR